MNRLMAILLLLGALGAFGLSLRTSMEVQDQTPHGAPVGEVRTVYLTKGDRTAYVATGLECLVAGFYFVAQIRRDDLRR